MKKGLAVFIAVLMLLSSFTVFAAGEAEPMATVSTPIIELTEVIGGVRVEITCATSSSKIYYTLDGTTPDTGSERYSSAFTLDEAGTHTIKAVAYNSSLTAKSSVATKTKTIYDCGFEFINNKDDENNTLKMTPHKTSSGVVDYITITIDGLSRNYTAYYTLGKASGLPSPSNSRAVKYTDPIRVEKRTTIYVRVFSTTAGLAPSVTKAYAAADKSWPAQVDIPQPSVELAYGGRSLKWQTETEGATIRYRESTSGIVTTELTEYNTQEYTGPIFINTVGRHYFKAYAVKDGMSDSDQTSGTACVTIEQCSAPTIPSPTSQGTRKLVTIKKADTEDVIFYTLDGSTPTKYSNRYTQPFLVGESCTVKAVAVRPGYAYSTVASRSVTASGGNPVPELPVPKAVTNETTGVKTITFTCPTAGAEIEYYIESKEPSLNVEEWTKYTEPLVFDKTGDHILFSRAGLNGVYSEVRKSTVRVAVTAAADAPSVPSRDGDVVVMSSGAKVLRLKTDAGCKIYYTLSDTKAAVIDDIPCDEAHLYTYPITVTKTQYINAVAVRETSSGIVKSEKFYAPHVVIDQAQVELEKVGELSKTETPITSGTGVTLSCADSDTDIFYVFDKNASTTADTGDTPYMKGSTIELTDDGYLHAVAAKPGYEYATATWQIKIGRTTAAPTITPVLSGTNYIIRFDCATPGAKYYFTKDGSDPTVNSEEAAGGIAVVSLESGDVTFKAIAVAEGYAPSVIVTQILAAGEIQKCEPVNGDVLDVFGGKNVILGTVTSDASIYYTTDGSEPSQKNGTLYEKNGIELRTAGTTKIRAVAVKNGCINSDIFETEVELKRLEAPVLARSTSQNKETGAFEWVYKILPPEGASAYYTTDGTAPKVDENGEPQGTSAKVTGYITFNRSCRLCAVSAAEGYATSAIKWFDVTMPGENGDVTPPMMTSLTSEIGGKRLALESSTEGAEIYYTTVKGVEPDILYTGPILIDKPQTIVYAVAKKNGMVDSPKMSYSVMVMRSEPPTASVPTNSIVTPGTKVELKCAEGGVIFYTLDGSAPTLNSPRYTQPIEINGETIIRAACASVAGALSPTADFSYSVEGETRAVVIDTSALERVNGEIRGDITVNVNGVENENAVVYAAIYSEDKMLEAKSVPLGSGSAVLKGYSSVADGTVIVKAFVLLGDGSIQPLCENAVKVF